MFLSDSILPGEKERLSFIEAKNNTAKQIPN
jgi:hypothetical protein